MNKTAKILVLAISLLLISISWYSCVSAQNAKLDKNGNFIAIQSKDTTTNKPTGKFFINPNGDKFPVFLTKNGKYYYIKTSKSGRDYKVYLKTE